MLRKEKEIVIEAPQRGENKAQMQKDFKEMDESFNKNHFALVFQDYLLKWPEVI